MEFVFFYMEFGDMKNMIIKYLIIFQSTLIRVETLQLSAADIFLNILWINTH